MPTERSVDISRQLPAWAKCEAPGCTGWLLDDTPPYRVECGECGQWVCGDCVRLVLPTPSSPPAHKRNLAAYRVIGASTSMPDKCGETRHIQLLSPELDATITRFAPDSKRRWHPEVYVACNHPQPEAKKRRLQPKAADVYPEMTGPFEPNDEWTAERQAFGEPDQMGVTIPIDYKTLLQSKEKSEYKQLSDCLLYTSPSPRDS